MDDCRFLRMFFLGEAGVGLHLGREVVYSFILILVLKPTLVGSLRRFFYFNLFCGHCFALVCLLNLLAVDERLESLTGNEQVSQTAVGFQ